MQRKDAVTGRFLENNERFADIMNVGCFEGEEIIKPEKLREVDRTSRTIIGDKRSNRKKAVTKYRDIVKETEIGMSRIILAIENQSKIHYAMPVRVMTMDALDYDKQLNKKANEHTEKKDLEGAEFLSGFSKTDKLMPVITIVVYYGENPWDGPKSLHELLDFTDMPEVVRRNIPDYPLHIIDIRRIENPESFKTDVGLVFEYLANAADKEKLRSFIDEHKEKLKAVPEDAFDVMTELTGHSNLSKIKEDKMVKNNEMRGEIDMKDALAELIEDLANELAEEKVEKLAEEKAEKLAEEKVGKLTAENEQKKVISHIQKNLAKNRSAEDIADFLGEDIMYVKEIENIINNNPEYVVDEIYVESKKIMV